MRPALLVCLALALSVAALFMMLRESPQAATMRPPRSGPASPEPAAPPPVVRERPGRGVDVAGEAAERGVETAAYVVPDGPAAVVGRIVDDEGAPLDGVDVTLERVRERKVWLHEDVAETESDEDGRFRIEGVDRVDRHRIRARADGRSGVRTSPFEVGTADPHDVGDLVLAAGAIVEGRVVDPAGFPVEGARLFVRHAHDATTDADGSFRLAGLRPGYVEVTVEADGFVSSHHPAGSPDPRYARLAEAIDSGEVRRVEFVLARPRSIRGRVTDERLRPLRERFRVSAHAAGDRRRSFADVLVAADGSYELAGLDPDQRFDVTVIGSSRRTRVRVGVLPGSDGVDFFLPPRPKVTVRIVDRGERPPEGLRVTLFRGTETAGDAMIPFDEPAPERVEIAYDFVGEAWIQAAANGRPVWRSPPFGLDGTNDHGPVVAVLEPAPRPTPTLEGVVVDATTRAPVVGVKVMLRSRWQGWRRTFSVVHGVFVAGEAFGGRGGTEESTRTDEDGRFVLHGDTRRGSSIWVADFRWASARVPIERDRHDLVMEVERTGGVAGLVVDAGTGAGPYAGIPVVAFRDDGRFATARTSADGSFRMVGLAPGPWSVAVGNIYAEPIRSCLLDDDSARERAAHAARVEVVSGRFASVSLDARRLGGALHGRVTIDGVPRSSHLVRLVYEAGGRSELRTHEAWTGPSGDYGFAGLEGGAYRLRLLSPTRHHVLAESAVRLSSGGVVARDLDVVTAAVDVVVVDGDGPLDAARVRLGRARGASDRPEWLSTGTTSVDGRTRFEGLAGGAYLLRTERRGVETRAEVVATAGAAREVVMRVE